MVEIGGFWSYAHADDEADGGRISQLARDVVAQYQMLTAEPIRLFLDRDDIEWGDEWRLKIDSTLESVAFFIAVLTPRYFRSVECRRELNFFARRAARIGVRELVLPLLYVDFPALHEEHDQDDAIELARSFQWQDWTKLRFTATNSPEYREAVSSLAQRLAAASASAETVETTETTVAAIQNADDADLGFIDRLARMEDELPELASTMENLASEIVIIGEIVKFGAANMERGTEQGKGFAARLTVFNEIAHELDVPVTRIVQLSNQFTTQLNEVDVGVKTAIEMISREIRDNPDVALLAEPFVTPFRHMIEQAEVGLGEMERVAKAIEPVEKGSRSARPVLRKLRKAVTLLAEGRSVTREWNRLLDELEI